jgi:hypothetical protein
MPAPGEGLIGDFDPAAARAVGQLAELLGDAGRIVDGVTDEQTSMVSVPSSSITANLWSARRRLALSWSGSTVSKSRNGWYRSIDRPRSAQR